MDERARPGAGSPSTIPRNPANAIPEFASVGRRIGAFFIDLGFTAVGFVGVAIVIGFIFGIVIAVSDGFPEDDGGISTSQEEALGYIVFGVWAGALFIGTWIANAMGGSIGKRILGLRIVDEQLQAPGWGTGLGRTLAAWLSWLAVGLGFLWATWDERQQTWHDKMAATFVVRDDSLPDRPNPRLLVQRPPGPGAGPGSLH